MKQGMPIRTAWAYPLGGLKRNAALASTFSDRFGRLSGSLYSQVNPRLPMVYFVLISVKVEVRM